MKKIFFANAFILLIVSFCYAQNVDLKQANFFEDVISETVTEVKELLLPFGAKAGFPDKRPKGLESATYEELYHAAAIRSKIGSELFRKLIEKNDFPWRIEYSARYFMKRLQIASYLYPEMRGNEKVFKHLCHDFAKACDRGFDELRKWGIRKTLASDIMWFKNIQSGFEPVKKAMSQATIPDYVAPAEARDTWRKAATALIEAGNAAGMASTRVGSGGLAAFPAWRLRLGMKYFKAAARDATVNMWHSRETCGQVWLNACERLRKDIDRINAEISNFLELHGGDN